jgi:uncharacterized membrane protein
MPELILIGGLPWWAIGLIALGIAALLTYQFVSLRQRLSLPQSILLVSLRGCVYVLLLLFLLSPALVKERITKLRNPLVLLLDTSHSMGYPSRQGGNGDKSRFDLVKETLLKGKAPLMDQLSRDYDLHLYQFNASLEPTELSALAQLDPHGKSTRLLEALWKAGRDTQGAAGIIVFSDGITNGVQNPGGSGAFPLPVFAVSVGETEGFTDLRITDLKAPEFAFRGREVQLDFTIEAYGLAGKEVPLYFKRGRNLISTRPITIDRDPFQHRITLKYTPREVGPQSFTLSLPAETGEMITLNNQREFKLTVQRDKIRVLSLSGSPSWNYRFLRLALKQDPFIDMVSFVFLRTPFDTVDVPENQLSLIPFPIDEIFLEELKNFDLIVLDNFSNRSYFNTLYLEKVRDFVSGGGGLAMLGGSRSFDGGGFWKGPLSELLPVELNGKGDYETDTRLRTVLTPAGKAHPITRIFLDSLANEEAWEKTPPLTTFNRVARPKGEMLLGAESDRGGEIVPVLTVGKFGTGRTLAFMSDDFWRWNFVAVGEKKSSQNHLKLIRQAVRWLTREPSFEQVQIVSIGGSRSPGEKMEFRVRVLKDDFTPASQANLRLVVAGPDGERVPLDAVPDTEAGEYSGEFIPAKEGSYRLEVEADLSGKPMGSDKVNFLVSFPHGERGDGRPRADLLKRIADLSQGEFMPISQWNEKSLKRIVQKLENLAPSQIVERQQIPLWNTPWIWAIILLLLGTEWWMRRSWGFV